MDQAEQLRNIVKKNQQSTRKARIFTVTSGKGGREIERGSKSGSPDAETGKESDYL